MLFYEKAKPSATNVVAKLQGGFIIMKKALAFVLASVMSVSMLAGCGSDSTGETTTGTEAATTGEAATGEVQDIA